MICPRCGAARFRSSRLRLSDLARLLVLQRPVRCRVCLRRRYVSIFAAMNLREKNGGPKSSPAAK